MVLGNPDSAVLTAPPFLIPPCEGFGGGAVAKTAATAAPLGQAA